MINPFSTADSPLEVLLIAEANLRDRDIPFDYYNWSCCACGHIYAATHKATPPRSKMRLLVISSTGRLYLNALRLIVAANTAGDRDRLITDRNLTTEVSRLTYETYRQDDRRTAALLLIQNAIRYERDRQDRDRRKIITAMELRNDAITNDSTPAETEPAHAHV